MSKTIKTILDKFVDFILAKIQFKLEVDPIVSRASSQPKAEQLTFMRSAVKTTTDELSIYRVQLTHLLSQTTAGQTTGTHSLSGTSLCTTRVATNRRRNKRLRLSTGRR